ncbi:MAG: NAD(P)-binding domain-containing protein [Myxococcota bacterium]
MTSWIATLLALAVVGSLALVALVTVGSLWWASRSERAARSDLSYARKSGAQPASLHPKIDLGKCIGSGSCVAVCPEKDVLALIDGKAVLANPTSCIGHGECLRACPVDAIELVLGTARRGVDIPLVSASFETNVPGIHVVGELGGMGLVYNAMTQGLQAMTAIGQGLPPRVAGVRQVLIVGAGPAGLAATLKAHELGLDYDTVDQETMGGTVLQYPRHKIVMTRPVTLPLYGALRVTEVRKEALLAKWQEIHDRTGIRAQRREGGGGVARRRRRVRGADQRGPVRAQRVVLALGGGLPRKLGIPGEALEKVTYRLLEPEGYAGKRCVVVGGGDSAVEAAVALGEAGADVVLSYRKQAFDRIKKKNQHKLDAAVGAGRVALLLGSEPVEIRADAVVVKVDGAERVLGNDYVLVFAGGVLPTAFLEAAGVQVQTFRGERYAPAN